MSLYEIIRQSITSQRQIDEKTVEAKMLLGERLTRLKELNPIFDGICFSTDVENIEVEAGIAVSL